MKTQIFVTEAWLDSPAVLATQEAEAGELFESWSSKLGKQKDIIY